MRRYTTYTLVVQPQKELQVTALRGFLKRPLDVLEALNSTEGLKLRNLIYSDMGNLYRLLLSGKENGNYAIFYPSIRLKVASLLDNVDRIRNLTAEASFMDNTNLTIIGDNNQVLKDENGQGVIVVSGKNNKVAGSSIWSGGNNIKTDGRNNSIFGNNVKLQGSNTVVIGSVRNLQIDNRVIIGNFFLNIDRYKRGLLFIQEVTTKQETDLSTIPYM